MATKQHAWALLTPEAKALLEQSMVAETGESVTVQDSAGNDVQVPEMHGGFALIGILDGWDFVVGCGMDFIFSAMVTQLQVVGQQVGHAVGVLFAIVDDVTGTETPDYVQLDVAMPTNTKITINTWLVAHGYEVATGTTYREVIECVGRLCYASYTIGKVTIS